MRVLVCLLFLAAFGSLKVGAESPAPKYWKGNLHTHSLWSDGDQFPEMIADWYRNHGYHFLALTDHNVLNDGMRWMSMKTVIKKSDAGVLDRYRKRFGDEWVETRGDADGDNFEVRLKPHSEYRALLEESGRFLLIPAEEVSNSAAGKPVHINATNIAEVIPPVKGPNVREVMEIALRSIEDHAKKHGREVLPHINHPNFHYAITAEDLASVVSEPFFEVYNGHPGINHLGDDEHPSVEALWDIANAIRINDLNTAPLMGIGTDDSHEHHGLKGSRPGRGWVMVRSRYLTPEHLIKAMKRGDFYASSGVSLSDVAFDSETKTVSLAIADGGDATFKTEFIGVMKGERTGELLATADGLAPSYKLTGGELYVRAVVTSSEAAVDPSFKDQKQQAWTQPVGWR